MPTLRRSKIKTIFIGLILLALLAGIYLWRQRGEKGPSEKVFSPFQKLSYPTAQLKDKSVVFAQRSLRLPSKANLYNKTPLTPPLLLENSGINKLKELLGLEDSVREMASGETIFWYANDRYLSYTQDSNTLTFSLNFRAQEHLPQKGQCPSPAEAKTFAGQFLTNNKLVQTQEVAPEQMTLTKEELTAAGLLPTSDENVCQTVKVNYQPLLEKYPLLSSQKNTFVRVMKVRGKNQVVGFQISSGEFNKTQTQLPLKNFSEIKESLRNNQGVLFESCTNSLKADTIKLSPPTLAYFENVKSGTVQPVFQLQVETADHCQAAILVKGLKTGWYKN